MFTCTAGPSSLCPGGTVTCMELGIPGTTCKVGDAVVGITMVGGGPVCVGAESARSAGEIISSFGIELCSSAAEACGVEIAKGPVADDDDDEGRFAVGYTDGPV